MPDNIVAATRSILTFEWSTMSNSVKHAFVTVILKVLLCFALLTVINTSMIHYWKS